MKLIFADSLDYVDPRYDFLADRSPADREPYWDDWFPHEILTPVPYDGILVSRGIVDRRTSTAKYTEAQARRFRMVGAREFLRYREDRFPGSLMFGDCGAFAYHKLPEPPYTPEDMVEFYEDGCFTHGCSVDHIIFQFDVTATGLQGGTEEARSRFDITLTNAETFLKASAKVSNRFTPIGVIQGWSPASMAEAAHRLQAMGYTYLAVGGMVPLKSWEIHACLDAIRDKIEPDVRLHILGFAKADDVHEFTRHQIASVDTTSPLIRAFKDARANYYLPNGNGGLHYFSAIRVPQAIENPKLMRGVKSGRLSAELLMAQEQHALKALRGYDTAAASMEEALEAVMAYAESMHFDTDPAAKRKGLATLRARYAETLNGRPWTKCSCAICRDLSIEVIIFRASNRNKRRGIHNLGVFAGHVRGLEGKEANAQELCRA